MNKNKHKYIKLFVILFICSFCTSLFFTYTKIDMNSGGEFCAYEVKENSEYRNINKNEVNWTSGGGDCKLLLEPILKNFGMIFSLILLYSTFLTAGVIFLLVSIKKIFKKL